MIITGPATKGMFPYRIEGHKSNGGIPIHGQRDEAPLLAACRALASIGEAPDQLVGLFDEGNYRYPDWRMRTTVGYGSRHFIGKAGFEKRERSAPGGATESSVGSRMRFRDEAGTSLHPQTETSPTGGGTAFVGTMDAGVPTQEPASQGLGSYPVDMGQNYEQKPSDQPLSGEQPAKPAEPRQRPRKSPAPPAGTGPAAAPPAKSGKSRRRPKRAKSGGRRAASRAR